MIKCTRYIILCFAYLLLFLNFANSFENKILFKVNNEIITSLDILNELQYLGIINKEFNNIKKEEAVQISKRIAVDRPNVLRLTGVRGRPRSIQ